ncbi:hypothetical protein EDC94DRAFT_691609 [Helicostylum pulchrum]|nr:hypothetical protein EDC94DRAFT_691609 [Helicostylum pulchrum]
MRLATKILGNHKGLLRDRRMGCTNYRSIIEFYPESEAEDMDLGYEYGEITTLTDFIAPVHNIQMDENL